MHYQKAMLAFLDEPLSEEFMRIEMLIQIDNLISTIENNLHLLARDADAHKQAVGMVHHVRMRVMQYRTRPMAEVRGEK